MNDPVNAARRLYEAIATRDARAILAAMTEDFVGDVSPGMPLGVGGRHEGREAMLRDVWGRVFAAYDVRLDVDRYLACGDDTIVAIGRYRGAERATAQPVDARFAHVLTVHDGHVSGLEQITDTRAWASEPR
jgi:ketosteroid isomerase-like protein